MSSNRHRKHRRKYRRKYRRWPTNVRGKRRTADPGRLVVDTFPAAQPAPQPPSAPPPEPRRIARKYPRHRQRGPRTASAARTRPPAQPAQPAQPAGPDADILIRAFLEGAGLSHLKLTAEQLPECMRTLGEIFRETVQGLVEVLLARGDVKASSACIAPPSDPSKTTPSNLAGPAAAQPRTSDDPVAGPAERRLHVARAGGARGLQRHQGAPTGGHGRNSGGPDPPARTVRPGQPGNPARNRACSTISGRATARPNIGTCSPPNTRSSPGRPRTISTNCLATNSPVPTKNGWVNADLRVPDPSAAVVARFEC